MQLKSKSQSEFRRTAESAAFSRVQPRCCGCVDCFVRSLYIVR